MRRIIRSSTPRRDEGFTLIELLVVVVIIGILAAIAIPVYVGVQNNAKDASVRSDVANAKTAVVSIQTGEGTLPASAPDIFSDPKFTDAGATKGEYLKDTVALFSKPDVGTFCVVGTSVSDSVFFAEATGGVKKVGDGTELPDDCKA